MIREYMKKDIDEIIKLLNLHNQLSLKKEHEKRSELEAGTNVLVYEDQEAIVGICYFLFWENPELGSCAEIIMSIEEEDSLQKIGNDLWEKAIAELRKRKILFLKTYYKEQDIHWREFYSEKQLEQWFLVHKLIYIGKKQENVKLEYRQYEENDFDNYYRALGKCFKSMRDANDIRPYDIYENSSAERIEELKNEMIALKESTYLYDIRKILVGAFIIKDGEIDDIFIAPGYQGKGYGRKMMKAIINLAIDKGYDEIFLKVVGWNRIALNLYESLGFENHESFEYRRLFLKYF